MTEKMLWLLLAGALGTIARYSMGGWVQRFAGSGFPWGTLTVNLAGCFLAGLLWAFWQNRTGLSADLRVILLIGFMGAFTTFSSFMLETANLIHEGEWLRAGGNVALNNAAGFAALFAGIALGKIF